MPWTWIASVFAALMLIIAGMSLVSYAGGVTARGTILPDEITITMAASKPATVSEIFVVATQRVRAGDRLLKLKADAAAAASRDHIVKAARDGAVSSLHVGTGDRLVRGQPLLQIVSGEGQPFAELQISPDTLGSIALGQRVRLALDAFPSARFGTLEGRVVGIARLKIKRPGTLGPIFVYRVKIRPAEPWIVVQGRKQALLPGMSVTARIMTTNRRLLDWFALPFSGAAGR